MKRFGICLLLSLGVMWAATGCSNVTIRYVPIEIDAKYLAIQPEPEPIDLVVYEAAPDNAREAMVWDLVAKLRLTIKGYVDALKAISTQQAEHKL